MSTFKVEIVPVVLEKHPNADTLSVIRIWGFTVVGKTADWEGVKSAAYIPPDSVVPTTRPEFAFLARPSDIAGQTRDTERITVRRFRGVYSQGLLVPAPEGSKIGDDVAAQLGVTHYEPPLSTRGGEVESPPLGLRPVYDVESFNRYPGLLVPGEPVIVTEKIHGANGRWCYHDDRFFCGSRTEWKREDEGNLWWRALQGCNELKTFLKAHPTLTAYGEVYGQVQDLKYDLKTVGIRIFDLWDGAKWIDGLNARRLLEAHTLSVPQVPLLFLPGFKDGDAFGPFDEAAVRALAEGKSTIAGHVREGCVIKPVVERTCLEIGRVQLKLVGNGYLERK